MQKPLVFFCIFQCIHYPAHLALFSLHCRILCWRLSLTLPLSPDLHKRDYFQMSGTEQWRRPSECQTHTVYCYTKKMGTLVCNVINFIIINCIINSMIRSTYMQKNFKPPTTCFILASIYHCATWTHLTRVGFLRYLVHSHKIDKL